MALFSSSFLRLSLCILFRFSLLHFPLYLHAGFSSFHCIKVSGDLVMDGMLFKCLPDEKGVYLSFASNSFHQKSDHFKFWTVLLNVHFWHPSSATILKILTSLSVSKDWFIMRRLEEKISKNLTLINSLKYLHSEKPLKTRGCTTIFFLSLSGIKQPHANVYWITRILPIYFES